jgi:hypothetical protein
MRLETAQGAPLSAQGDRWALPRAFPGFDLEQLNLGANEKTCVKGFLGPLPPGEATTSLLGAGGERLTVSWSTEENPLLGLWLSRGCYGWHHLALEPTNGAPDRLDEAVEKWRCHGQLAPGETRRWRLRLRVG